MECSPQLSKSILEGRVYNDNRAVTSRSVDTCGHYMGGNMCVCMYACMRECVHVCMMCAGFHTAEWGIGIPPKWY